MQKVLDGVGVKEPSGLESWDEAQVHTVVDKFLDVRPGSGSSFSLPFLLSFADSPLVPSSQERFPTASPIDPVIFALASLHLAASLPLPAPLQPIFKMWSIRADSGAEQGGPSGLRP